MPIDFTDTAANFLEFPSHYYYHFQSSDGLELWVLRDEGVPKITGGLGGWEIVSRRRRKGLTNWVGREPWQMSVPILFNGWFDPPYSIDSDVAILNRMAFGDNFVIPPTLTVDGVLPVNGVRWVIQNLEYGDNAAWLRGEGGDMIRVRQDCVVSLLQYVEEDVVPTSSTTSKKSSNLVPPHTTVKGETPKGIAKAVYNNGEHWKLIRNLNPTIVRSPFQVLDGGIVLQMPSRDMPLPPERGG